jgi:hypothetical protein
MRASQFDGLLALRQLAEEPSFGIAARSAQNTIATGGSRMQPRQLALLRARKLFLYNHQQPSVSPQGSGTIVPKEA